MYLAKVHKTGKMLYLLYLYIKKYSTCELLRKNKIALYVHITKSILLNTSEILIDSKVRTTSGPNLVSLLRKNETKWRNKLENQWSKNHRQSSPNYFLNPFSLSKWQLASNRRFVDGKILDFHSMLSSL